MYLQTGLLLVFIDRLGTCTFVNIILSEDKNINCKEKLGVQVMRHYVYDSLFVSHKIRIFFLAFGGTQLVIPHCLPVTHTP